MAKKQSIDARIEELLGQMTLLEKVSLLSGKDIWNTVPIKRLGIPSITMTDGPHGVRASNPEVGRPVGPTTCFPTGVSMAASWNVELVEKIGQAIGEETRGMDCDIILGPCVNIVRYPLGGRNFESYSEDPYLAGRTAVAFIKGVQSRGVGTSLKHYAANNYEIERGRANSVLDERTLREIYLVQFEAAVKEAQPWTVMCSYNRINGVYASQHDYLLNKVLKEEWGFEGFVVSDWGANHTIFESIQGGLDLEMPGPERYYKFMPDSLHNFQIDEEAIDKAVRRILRIVIKSGRMEGTTSKGSVNTPEHQALARKLAEEAITLLKNDDGILPVGKTVKTIAVLGPNAEDAVIEGGGSSRVIPPYRVSPLDALKTRLDGKVRIEFERGCDNSDSPFIVPASWIKEGLHAEFFADDSFSGKPMMIEDGHNPDFWFHTGWVNGPIKPASVRWTGKLTVPEDGLYKFALTNTGAVRILVDGHLVLERKTPLSEERNPSAKTAAVVKLAGGKAHDLQIDYVRLPDQEVIHYSLGISLTFDKGKDPRAARALVLAKRADLVLFFAGYPDAFETEGTDRPHMDLGGGQNELIAALAAANPKTVVVLNAGSPITMPWADKVAAIVEAYYPGLENGNAVAAVLLGEVNPSGKLPVTFPKRLQDSPAFINASYPGAREVNYGEGIFVGYRYFDKVDLDPLFPFGHGLSYTAFKYSELKLPRTVKAGQPVEISLTVTNTGKVAGKEIVQLYMTDPESSLPRPPKELKAFAKVDLKPGASKEVTFTLDQRSMAFYDPHKKQWVAEPGEFQVLVGSSSRDIRLKGKFTLK